VQTLYLDNQFDLPLQYKGSEHLLPAALITYGYSYKIEVNVFGHIIYFEPDEERNFRAILSEENNEGIDKIDKALFALIAVALEELFK
jgi:hypothetical protein